MVIPISSDNSDRRTTPVVNYAIIALNVLIFLLAQGMGTNDKFTYAFACVPEEILTGRDLDQPVSIENPITKQEIGQIDLQPLPGHLPVYITLLTSMFMHGGWMHLLGNMLFLWIFGDNIEDDVGHLRYVAFYLICGVIASLAHVAATFAFGGNPYIPSLGASGAISGVMGGYLLMHPTRRVTAIVFGTLTRVPAYVAIGMWFVFQIISSLGALGGGTQAGGVAYAAHIGGFIAGLVLVKLFSLGRDVDRRPTRAILARWDR